MTQKILLIRFSSIGDIVLTTPVIRCLAKQLPHLELHVLTKSQYAGLYKSNPYIQQVHELQDSLFATAIALKKFGFSQVIDLHNNLRTAQIKAILGLPSYSYNKLNFEKYIRVRFKQNILPPLHIVDRYMETVAHLDVKNDGEGLDYFIPDADRLTHIENLDTARDTYYTWAIGAQHFTKRLPVDDIVKIINRLDHPVVLLGGKEDAERGEEIRKKSTHSCYNLAGKLGLNQSADAVKNSRRLFTNDTGLMHIAAALKVPTTSFWGSTLPEFGMTPYYGIQEVAHEIIENKTLACRSCSKIGHEKCPQQHFKCMQGLAEVWALEQG